MAEEIDFNDLLMEVEAELQAIFDLVLKELQLPEMKQALRVRWMTMPDEMKEMLRDDYPETYKQIEMIVKEGQVEHG